MEENTNYQVANVSKEDEFLIIENEDFILLEANQLAPHNPKLENSSTLQDVWKVMIIDDDESVHQATKLALKSFVFEGKSLSIIHGFSGAQAQELIATHPDTAFILLDVVMETNDAGLKVVRYIREELKNHLVQIVLRTGQPGDAPEESVIRDYDINDYKLKVELTRQRLITTVISALRAYRNVVELEEKTQKLTDTIEILKHTQSHLIQSEKMSSLGLLVAGIAHEINNPVSFIYSNLTYAHEYIASLIELINLYKEIYPQPRPEIQAKIEDIELDYLVDDLGKILGSMKLGSIRISKIVESLRNFSHLDEAELKPVDIHSGIESTLLILQHRLNANEKQPEINIIKCYSELPLVNCYASALNQVFMNIINNAIDALRGTKTCDSDANKELNITITTFVNNAENVVVIIANNGAGMEKSVVDKIFDLFYTTKPVGSGTGLGLSISYSIIVEKHHGKLSCFSTPDEGTEFIIEIPVNYS
jgi:signal transduction histidine kinase